MDELRLELAGPLPTLIRRLLAERVTLTWAAAHLADLDSIHLDKQIGPAVTRARRRRESTHRMYLAALQLFAKLDKMLKKAARPQKRRSDGLPNDHPRQGCSHVAAHELVLRPAI